MTDSTTPKASPLASSFPISGSSTYTTSPNSACDVIRSYGIHSRLRCVIANPVHASPSSISFSIPQTHLRMVRHAHGGHVSVHLGPLVALGVLQAIHHCVGERRREGFAGTFGKRNADSRNAPIPRSHRWRRHGLQRPAASSRLPPVAGAGHADPGCWQIWSSCFSGP